MNHYPTRLIDVDPKDGSIRLVTSTTEGVSGEYLTLSHRWTSNMVMTTRQCLEAHQIKLPLEKFSQWFRDAIEITRQLGFRFIWIDALCIIQDSPFDLQNECSHMKDIYRQCSVMLAADCVENSKDSLYPIRPEYRATSLPFREANGQQASHWILSNRELSSFDSDVNLGVLSSRGWTLQERILAPRIFHFGKAQVHWECPNSIWWERTDFKYAFYTPFGLDEARNAMIGINRKNLQTIFPRKTAETAEGCTRFTIWYDLVSGYSCRQLTLPEDRLTAISGLADLFAQILQDQHIWGLWRRDMPAGLLWTVQVTGIPRRLAAPSWSWVSITGELTFHIPRTMWGRPIRGLLRTACEEFVLEDSANHQHIYSNGKLSCHCPIIKVRLSVHKGIEEDDEYPYEHLRQQPNAKVHEVSSGQIVGNATLDDDTLLRTQCSSLPMPSHAAMLYCQTPLPDHGQRKRHRKQVSLSYCVLLRPLIENGSFERFGYAEIQLKAFFEAKMTRISII
ncbi:hypothetical protein MMC17_001060 [Xylographa soralifera]|nr:hypothetical protein [Xylographa soralifera]